MIYISKSKIKQNKQCSKLLWLEINKPKLKKYSSETLKTFSRGRDVESIAKEQFPNSKEVKAFKHIDKLKQTDDFLKTEQAIFEASFVGNEVFIQVDILNKIAEGLYDVIEIKSGTKISPEYLDDVIIQYFAIIDSKKININKYYIWNVNNQATSEKDLFNKIDVTDKLKDQRDYYEKLVGDAKKISKEKSEPVINIGPHCTKPYECPFRDYCWKSNISNSRSVINLPKFSEKWKAYYSGIKTIDDEKFLTQYSYKEDKPIMYESIKSGKLVIDQKFINESLTSLVFPLYFFDFESLMGAIPEIEGQRPYQQMVFQHSIHKLTETSDFSHYSFLHNSLKNPDDDVVKSIHKFIGEKGSIVTYNKTFEITRIKELAEKFKDTSYGPYLLSLIPRFIDLLDIIEKAVYHPLFMGSFFLKVVAPILLGKNGEYTDSKIKSGSEVGEIFLQYVRSQNETEKKELKNSLLEYNKRDTLNLVLLYLWLKNQSEDLDFHLNKFLSFQTIEY